MELVQIVINRFHTRMNVLRRIRCAVDFAPCAMFLTCFLAYKYPWL